jgi:hypothetical protein
MPPQKTSQFAVNPASRAAANARVKSAAASTNCAVKDSSNAEL